MTTPLSLEQTLKYRRMLREGVTPDQLQKKADLVVQQQFVTAARTLVEREETVEKTVLDLVNQIKKSESFDDVEEGVASLESICAEIQEAEEELRAELESRKQILQRQQKQQQQVIESIDQYRRYIESTPTKAESAVIGLGNNLSANIRNDRS